MVLLRHLAVLLSSLPLLACQQAERKHFDHSYAVRGNAQELNSKEVEPAYLAFANATLAQADQEKFDTPPRLVRAPQPIMPTKDMIEEYDGEVTVKVHFTERGDVGKLELLRSTKSSFTAAAYAALWQWKIEPPTSGGNPRPFVVIQKFNFRTRR